MKSTFSYRTVAASHTGIGLHLYHRIEIVTTYQYLHYRLLKHLQSIRYTHRGITIIIKLFAR